jgi:hypothetical protein
MQDTEFQELLTACGEIAQAYPEGVVFIGGIAVYLHAVNSTQAALAEFTHDADFYISLADIADLRDQEELVTNRRLSKHQMVKRGFEFDIYTERQASLAVPYEAVRAHAEVYGGIRVASLEHLLVLKLEAFRDRGASAKGAKDAKDVLRIAAVAAHRPQGFRAGLAAPYLREEHDDLLDVVDRGPYATALARGNAVRAKELRAALGMLVRALRGSRPEPRRRRPRP